MCVRFGGGGAEGQNFKKKKMSSLQEDLTAVLRKILVTIFTFANAVSVTCPERYMANNHHLTFVDNVSYSLLLCTNIVSCEPTYKYGTLTISNVTTYKT